MRLLGLRLRLRPWWCFLVFAWFGQAVSAKGGVGNIHYPDQPVPGAPGETFNGLVITPGSSALSPGGTLVFYDTGGVWRWDAVGGLELVVGSGDPAPGAGSGVMFQVPLLGMSMAVNDAGEIALIAKVSGAGVTTSNDFGLWGPDGAGGLRLIAREGSPAPGTGSGVTFASFRGPPLNLNGAGQVAFRATLAGSGVTTSNDIGIWIADPSGGVELIAREGEPAPGAGLFLEPGIETPLNDAGQVAFVAGATGGGGLWRSDGAGGLDLVVRTSDPAPGTSPGVPFDILAISHWALNDAGELAFWGSLAGPGDDGIWGPDGAGGIRLVARDGDPVPGAPGSSFWICCQRPALNESGEVAFDTFLASPAGSPSAIVVAHPSGALRVAARNGDPAPDVPGAALVDLSQGVPVSLNDLGDVVFTSCTGTDEFTCSNTLNFASAEGELVTLATEGDPLEVAPGDVRTLFSSIYLDHLDRGFRRGVSNGRSVPFAAPILPGSENLPQGERGFFVAALHTDCVDGIDNDGDGVSDYDPGPGDPGCESAADPSEHARRWVCDDGEDDDGDGLADFPADPGCNNLIAAREDPQCQDGVNNDGKPGIDFDGGASLNGGVPLDVHDPQCAGRPWWNQEAKAGLCGLGFEALLVVWPLVWWRARRKRPGA